MKSLFFFFLIYLFNCHISLKDGDFLEFYKNYTLIPPIGGKIKNYYIEPHFEVGTVDLIMYFSNSALSCAFEFYDGNILFDSIKMHYTDSLNYTLKIPPSRPSIIRMEVSNLNNEDPYYLYMYNKNYKIPLSIQNYYSYQISVKDLDILYEINDLKENVNLHLEAKIEYPQYNDSINIIVYNDDNTYSHLFDQTSSFEF